MDEYMIYTTVEGDTFDSIAFEFYTDEKMASVIIDANPLLADVLIFDADVEVLVPIVEEAAETPGTAPPWRNE